MCANYHVIFGVIVIWFSVLLEIIDSATRSMRHIVMNPWTINVYMYACYDWWYVSMYFSAKFLSPYITVVWIINMWRRERVLKSLLKHFADTEMWIIIIKELISGWWSGWKFMSIPYKLYSISYKVYNFYILLLLTVIWWTTLINYLSVKPLMPIF